VKKKTVIADKARNEEKNNDKMMIQVLVDTRERGLLEHMTQRQDPMQKNVVEIKTQVLELGDVHIVITDDKSNSKRTLVYERKTLPDMISSITDGRYREQKVRLLATYAPKDIAYIIEGDDMHESLSRANHSVSSAYLNMVYRDNIHLFFTKNVEQTSFFILSVCSKILSTPKNYLQAQEDRKDISVCEYTSHIKIKSKKSHNITPDNCFLLQLSQIPTISHVVAKKIAAIYPSMSVFLCALQKCSSQPERLNLLSSVKMVGKEKATKILLYMKI